MKKVGFDLYPCLDSNMSGIGMFTYETVKRFKSDSNTEYCGNIFVFNDPNVDTQTKERMKDMNIKINYIQFPFKYYRYTNFLGITSYDNYFPKNDVNVFFNYDVPGRIKGKVITFFHDMTYLRFPETVKGLNYLKLKFGMPRFAKRADIIATVSEFSKKEMVELMHIDPNKIRVVYPSASISDDLVEYKDLKEKYQFKDNYLLFVGNIEPRKNIKRLISAYNQLRDKYGIDNQLVLVGGKGWNNDDIYEEVNNSKYKDDIIFTGYVRQAEKNTFYKNANLFIFSTLYEGFGIPPLEAMHFDCPVVASNVASVPEVVGKAAQMVDPYNVDDIVSGIYQVITNKELRNSLIEEGKKQREKFSWEKTQEQLNKVIEEVLK